MRTNHDVIIVGAGAVGCAVARELSRYDLSVAVLEKNSDVAGETSGRNSAVVHAGFNNRTGSLMAKLCVKGNEGFASLCRELDVPYRETGKLIVALSEEDEKTLRELLLQGQRNGCRDMRILKREELGTFLQKQGMPECGWCCALYSPHTAVTSPFLYCVALAENAQANGAEFYLNTEVTGILKEEDGGFAQQRFAVSAGKRVFRSRWLINCAGLYADRISDMAGVPRYRIWPCRGEYFILDKTPLAMPVYPAPRKSAGGLGVHLTPTIDGNIIIGPSAEYLDARDDYSCTAPVMEELMAQAKLLLPGIGAAQPIGNYSGIRPKLTNPRQGGYHDFVIEEEKEVPGLVNLIGIESPGLTASVPIAEMVRGIIEEKEQLTRKDDFNGTRRGIIRFREQTPETQARLISEDPDYGEIICRCQKITKKEIRQAIENPLGAVSVSAVKYRAWATTGRCGGGYCLPRIVEILTKEYGLSPEEIRLRNDGSEMFTGRVK